MSLHTVLPCVTCDRWHRVSQLLAGLHLQVTEHNLLEVTALRSQNPQQTEQSSA